MERLQNSQFTFTNKENSLLPHKAVPKTPRQSHNNGNNNNDNKNHKNHKIPVFDDSISTPNKKSTNNNVKRVPLGGKDKNSTRLGLPQKSAGTLHDRGLHLSASAKKRARRLRTPLGKSVNRKLDILRDPEVDNDVVVKKATATTNDVNPFSRPQSSVSIDDYDEIEHVPAKQPELPYIPLNYTPFTDEDLEVLKRSPIDVFQDGLTSAELQKLIDEE
ncbi:Securin [Cyberlindnera fabianii]|uniref:Securin n=1 Tax=Cyberlindnera fabianii TaxID=36022 RepID=A0A1V2L536_CYBFA|nr:Securin [Cyberlindnera fabianii]